MPLQNAKGVSRLFAKEDVPLVEFMYLVLTRMPGESYRSDSGLCCCTRATYFERELTPLCVDFS